MTDYPEIAARFARAAASHQMTVLHDDGLYRHLRFQPPPTMSSCYWFDLITVPGALIFQGDGETFAFRRVTDMFEFFRHGIWRDSSIHINPVYWSEKLTSDRDSVMKYSQKLFEEEVARDLAAAEEDYPGITEAWAEHLEDEFNVEYEEEARRALDEFRFGEQHRASCSACIWQCEDESYTAATQMLRRHRKAAGEEHTGTVRDLTFAFSDTWEWKLKDFHWWFLWACHGVPWGIARYDRLRYYGLQDLAPRQARAAAEFRRRGALLAVVQADPTGRWKSGRAVIALRAAGFHPVSPGTASGDLQALAVAGHLVRYDDADCTWYETTEVAA
jgi:hypothetical protein